MTQHTLSRRSFFQFAAAIGLGAAGKSTRAQAASTSPARRTLIRIENVSVSFEDFEFRSPFQFAGATVTRQRMATAKCVVRTAAGKEATGFGVLPHNYTFTYPSKTMSPDDRLAAMKALAEECAKVTAAHREFGHPIDLNWDLAPQYERAAADVSQRLKLPDPIPKLCTLVVAAVFDAALHDAYGKVHGVSSFHTYGPEHMPYDLSRYLGPDYRGEYPTHYVRAHPKTRLPACHTITGVDHLTPMDVKEPLRDGLPENLSDWVKFNGLIYFKPKFSGLDLKNEVERMTAIDRVVTEVQRQRGVERWAYLPDFNEKCPHVDYFIEFLQKFREQSPEGFLRIEYVEQPTHRDLAAHPENDMHVAAKLRPVVIDESVIDVESVLLAKKLGWTGLVVKSPKGLTHMLLMAAVAGKQKLLVAGGDMSCPGAAFIQTAAFQARLPGVTNIEANARQFLPKANGPWEPKFPGMFRITDGMLRTDELVQPGLGVAT